MDPTLDADIVALRSAVDNLKGAKAAVLPLNEAVGTAQTGLDTAKANAAQGNQVVADAETAIDAALAKIEADVATIKSGGTPAPAPAPAPVPPDGGGTSSSPNQFARARR